MPVTVPPNSRRIAAMSRLSSNQTPAELSSPVTLYVKKGGDRRLRFGHPWIFSNEIDTRRSPLRGLEPGDPVTLRNSQEVVLGCGYVNPQTLISVRLVSRHEGCHLEPVLLADRLDRAIAARDRQFSSPFYRAVYGESDGLPGLVVDRYGDVLVAQFTTAGMERLREAVVAALVERIRPRAVYLKNDTGARELEGLEMYAESAYGELPESIHYEEHGARFEVAPRRGQKTGWFFDHRANRRRVLAEAEGCRVLDLFCYTGAWGIQTAVAGAREVLCVDTSGAAVEQVARHAALNGVAERVFTERADAFECLRALRAAGERFDLVIADPPAFIRRKKDSTKGFEAYRRLNGLAMQLVNSGGMLVSASCSFHLPREKLIEIIARVSGGLGRRSVIVGEGHQDVDHPVHPAVPETSYLKTFFVRVEDDG